MNLYIEIKDGQPINHPAFEDNLIEAFGQVPSNWEPFVRVERPVPGRFEVLDSQEPTYQKIDGVWTDVWTVRPMTQDEKNVIFQRIKDDWAARPDAANWTAWTFNEETMWFDPPVPRPERTQAQIDARIYYRWCGAENNWKETPPLPEGDESGYRFNFLEWHWVKL